MNGVFLHFNVYLPYSSASSSTWLSLLRLMLSNDVERNPGPVSGEVVFVALRCYPNESSNCNHSHYECLVELHAGDLVV